MIYPQHSVAVSFDRIGRNHSPAALLYVSGADTEQALADDIAEHVYRHAGRYLASREWEADVDLFPEDDDGDTYSGQVFIDGGRFGQGSLVVKPVVHPAEGHVIRFPGGKVNWRISLRSDQALIARSPKGRGKIMPHADWSYQPTGDGTWTAVKAA